MKPSESLFNQVLTYQPHYSVQHAYCTCSNGRVDCTKGSKNPHKRVRYFAISDFNRAFGLDIYLFTGGDDGRETNSRLDGISSLFVDLLLRKYILYRGTLFIFL